MTIAQSSAIRLEFGSSRRRLAVAQVAEVEGEDTSWPQGVCGGGQRALDRGLVGEVAEDVADGDDRVALGKGVVGENELPYFRAGRCLPGERQHRGRGVRSDDVVSRLDEMPGEEAAPAAELEDEAAAHGLEEREDARAAGVGMEAEAEVVHQREIVAVVRQAASPAGSPHVCQRSTSKSTLIPL